MKLIFIFTFSFGLFTKHQCKSCDPHHHNLYDAEGNSVPVKTFPDIDYAMYGYNIMTGYPHAVGSDPGFSHPIFKADYSEKRQSADLRFTVPDGYHALEDVACTTSFTSEVQSTTKQLSKSLAASAQASGGGWGLHFSVSAGYKKASSSLYSGKSIYIISSASCTYYVASMDLMKPPSFEDGFVERIKSLQNGKETDVWNFFDYYGTHFLIETTFGARYTFHHEMKTSTYQEMKSKNIDVSVSASYAGLFDIGGGFTMDSNQMEQASNFSENVKTTTTSVGAPPPSNGDALTWASTVKVNPLPVNYKLASIEDLFTDRFMKELDIDYDKIREKVIQAKSNYIPSDPFLDEGPQGPWLIMSDTAFPAGSYRQRVAEQNTCIQDCIQDQACMGLEYSPQFDNCSFFANDKYYADEKTVDTKFGSTSFIFLTKLTKVPGSFTIFNARIPSKWHNTSVHLDDAGSCEQACLKNTNCDVYVYCDPNPKTGSSWCQIKNPKFEKNYITNCLFYSTSDINQIVKEDNNYVHFISRIK